MDGKRPVNRERSQGNEPNSTSETTSNTDTNRPTPPPDATLMANYSTAAATMGQFDQSYDNLFLQLLHPEATSIPPFLMQQTALSPPTDFLWNPSMPQQLIQQQPQAGQSQDLVMNMVAQLQGHSDTMQGTANPQSPPAAPDATGHIPIPPDVELEVTEEKRRRNTAASARFRIKKKHKTITLERSVTDLTGRADELEREVADLRRENGWLKEIVMLKGAQHAANNQAYQEALRQAAALVTRGQTGPAVAQGSGSKEGLEESEEGSESYEEDDKNSKGKKPARTGKKA